MATYNKLMDVVDHETGEITETTDRLKTSRTKTKEEKSRDRYQMEKRIASKEIYGCSNCNLIPNSIAIQLFKVLKHSEYEFFLRLLEYMPYNCNILMRKDYPDEYARIDYFVESIVDSDGNNLYSKQAVKNFLTKFKKVDLIASTSTTDSGLHYMVNPWVAHKGKLGLSDSLYKTFKNSRWRDFPRK